MSLKKFTILWSHTFSLNFCLTSSSWIPIFNVQLLYSLRRVKEILETNVFKFNNTFWSFGLGVKQSTFQDDTYSVSCSTYCTIVAPHCPNHLNYCQTLFVQQTQIWDLSSISTLTNFLMTTKKIKRAHINVQTPASIRAKSESRLSMASKAASSRPTRRLGGYVTRWPRSRAPYTDGAVDRFATTTRSLQDGESAIGHANATDDSSSSATFAIITIIPQDH